MMDMLMMKIMIMTVTVFWDNLPVMVVVLMKIMLILEVIKI